MQREGCAIAATMEPIGSIRPHPRNPRKNDGAVGTVAGLIQRFGFAAPIVCQASTRTILAGHTRIKAALSLGLQEVPVRFIDVDDDAALAYMLADNKSSELAEWDDAQVAAILSELDGADVDVAGLGWSDEEISAILEGDDEGEVTDPDEAPEPTPGPPDSQPGQVYELGPHRLWCGDNTDPDIRAAASVGVGAVVTDPPYGIAAPRIGTGSKSQFSKGDASARASWDDKAPSVAWLLDMAARVVVWGGNYFSDLPPSADWLVWHKKNDGRSFAEAELAWTNLGRLARVLQHHWSGETKEHITQKPLAVIVWSLGFVPEGATVLDPYAGSGTTLIACAETGRVARCIELDPTYCDVIRRRWTRYAKERRIDPGTGALDG